MFDFTAPLLLENDRVRLQPLQTEHIAELTSISVQHPDLLRYSPSPFGSIEQLQAYITEALQQKEKQLRYPLVIFDKEHQKFAGSTSFGNVSEHHQRLEIGWTWIAPAQQRSGLNRAMKFLMLHYAFEVLGYQRVEFKIDSRNAQSRRAVEAIGAELEGELRSHSLMPDGFRRNTCYYGILAADWPGIKERVFAHFP